MFFFFKQKTAYEMRISDWSSDVCSSDLVGCQERVLDAVQGRNRVRDRAGTDREEQCGQPEDDAEHGKRCSEACESLAQGGMGGRSHLSMPPSARMSRADASPVTCMESRPMIPRNLLV